MKLAAVAVLVAAVLAAPAGARKVDWHEQKSVGAGAMRFRVTTIDLTRTSWRVTATITNASKATIRFDSNGAPLTAPRAAHEWHGGLALLHDGRYTPPNPCCQSPVVWIEDAATRIAPAPPRTLAPGASWTGTFGGSARLKPGRAYRVGFGSFSTDDLTVGALTFTWITDHSTTL